MRRINYHPDEDLLDALDRERDLKHDASDGFEGVAKAANAAMAEDLRKARAKRYGRDESE